MNEEAILLQFAKDPADLKKHRGRIAKRVREVFDTAEKCGVLKMYKYNESTRVYSWEA